MNSFINKVMIGSRKFGSNAQRYLGHAQRGIRVLGSTTKALNQVGISNGYLNKVNSFAQRLDGAINPIQQAIANY